MSEAWQQFAEAATRSDKFLPLGIDSINQITAHAVSSLTNVDTTKNGEIRAQCPLHVSDTGMTQTLRINLSPYSKYGIGFFKCYSCKKHGHWNILADELGIDNIMAEPNPHLSNILRPLHQEREIRDFDASVLSTLPQTFAWDRGNGIIISNAALSIVEARLWYRRNVAVPKLDEKGKPVLLANKKWEVDFYVDELRLWMPVLEEEASVAHVAALIGERHWWSKKYLNARGDWPKKHIWPLNQILKKMRERKFLVICEGPADALRLIDKGIPAIANLGVSAWTAAKADIIAAHFNRVIICFDADAAGADAQREVRESFEGLIPVTCINLPKGKDPASLSEKELAKLISIIKR